MKDLQNIANLIEIRNFLSRTVESLDTIRLSKEEVKSIQSKVNLMDRTIIDQSLKLDLLKLNQSDVVENIVEKKKSTALVKSDKSS